MSSVTKEVASLCTLIIKQDFGESVSKVASECLSRGRLSLTQLMIFTKLPKSQIIASLLILIQHHLVVSSPPSTELVTQYETDSLAIMLRLRHCRYTFLARELFEQILMADTALELVQNILEYGSLTYQAASDMLIQDFPSLKEVFLLLVQRGYLIVDRVELRQSKGDTLIMFEQEEKDKKRISGNKHMLTPKEKESAKINAARRLKELYSPDYSPADAGIYGLKRVEQRGSGKGSKQSSRVSAAPIYEIIPDLQFKVNRSKFDVHLRNSLAVSLCESRFNSQAATVLRAALRHLEPASQLEDNDSVTILPHQIQDKLPSDLPKGYLKEGLSLPKDSKMSSKDVIPEYCAILSSDHSPESSKSAYIDHIPGRREYKIKHGQINDKLKRAMLNEIVLGKYGQSALRVMNILIDKGKLEEKHIAKIGMLATKESRELIGKLSSASLIELQEIPRSTERQPGRTFYLWYVDLDKCYAALLNQLYKTLANILERKAHEIDARSELLAKQERTDVKLNPELLTDLDRNTHEEMMQSLNMLSDAEQKIEQSVLILRDLPSDNTMDSN